MKWKKNIRIVIVRNNELINKVKASAVIVINEEDLLIDYYDNEYYIYNSNTKLISLDRISLENKFFITNNIPTITKAIPTYLIIFFIINSPTSNMPFILTFLHSFVNYFYKEKYLPVPSLNQVPF